MTVVSEDACADFVAKWQQREPEMHLAEVFCPASSRPHFRAWGALLHELREALFELSDPRVTGIKTGWWAEELIAMPGGQPRHPLTQALAGIDAPWQALGRALLTHADADVRASDTAQAVELLLPTAKAVVAVEAAVFSAGIQENAAPSLAVHWLLHRLPQGLAGDDQARIPMHLYARHGLTAAEVAAGQGEALLRDWAGELARVCPGPLRRAALIRRSRQRFDQARLQRLAAGKGFAEPPAPITLWRAWRAARDV